MSEATMVGIVALSKKTAAKRIMLRPVSAATWLVVLVLAGCALNNNEKEAYRASNSNA
jgi:hypothetical protein